MGNEDKILQDYLTEYKNSEFHKKYKDEDKYYDKKILKEVFNCMDIKKSQKRGLNTYEKIYIENIKVMKDLLTLYYDNCKNKDNYLMWLIISSIYIDPDDKAIKRIGGVKCSADGLISKKRLFDIYGFSLKMINEYEQYRKVPIFFFPREKNDINQTRSKMFGDRIDYTLYDIKMYYENPKKCKMKFTYSLPETKKWLNNMKNFEKIIDDYGVKGIFTNEDYEVFDLEKGNEVISDYKSEYPYNWSNTYYNNLKEKIDAFMSKKSNQ